MTVLDFAQGFGAVQMSSGMPTNDAPLGAFYHENSLTTDGMYYYSIYVGDPSKDVSVTVAWYDPPSSVSSYNVSFFSCVFLRLPPPGHPFFMVGALRFLVAWAVGRFCRVAGAWISRRLRSSVITWLRSGLSFLFYESWRSRPGVAARAPPVAFFYSTRKNIRKLQKKKNSWE